MLWWQSLPASNSLALAFCMRYGGASATWIRIRVRKPNGSTNTTQWVGKCARVEWCTLETGAQSVEFLVQNSTKRWTKMTKWHSQLLMSERHFERQIYLIFNRNSLVQRFVLRWTKDDRFIGSFFWECGVADLLVWELSNAQIHQQNCLIANFISSVAHI